MKKIDVENHFYFQNLIDALKAREARGDYPYCTEDESMIYWTRTVDMPQKKILPLLLDLADERYEVMKANGVTTAVLSCSAGAEQLDREEGIRISRETNDLLCEVIKKYPDMYLGSAALPVQDVDAACAELERCVKELGFVCWHTHSNYGKESPDMEKFRPIFQKAADLGVYVYLHPQLPDYERLTDFGFTFGGPGLGFTVDAMIMLSRMIVSGIFDEISNLKVVVGHLGEAIPFLIDRMENRLHFLPNPKIRSKQTLRYYFEHNIMVSTSGNMSEEAFECTKKVLGLDRIVFATDYPYEEIGPMVSFLNNLPLSAEEQEIMFSRNAVEKLGIPR